MSDSSGYAALFGLIMSLRVFMFWFFLCITALALYTRKK